MAEPLSIYVTDRLKEWPHEARIIVPVIRVGHWYQRVLVNQSLRRLRTLVGRRRNVELIEQPFGVGSRPRPATTPGRPATPARAPPPPAAAA